MALAGLVLFLTILRSNDPSASSLSYTPFSTTSKNKQQQQSKKASSSHKAVIPTLLSLIHPETNTFLYALDNELYKTLAKLSDHVMTHTSTLSLDQMPYEAKQKESSNNNDADEDDATLLSRVIVEPPTLNVDRTRVRYGESMLVTWTPGRTVSGEAVLRNDSSSIIILTCGTVPESPFAKEGQQQQQSSSSSSSLSSFLDENFVVQGHVPPIALEQRVVLEAATLEQVRATSAFHKGHTPMIQRSNAVMLSMSHQQEPIHSHPRDDDHDDHNHQRRLGDKGGSSSDTAAASDASASNNEWYIPSFPVIRQEACQFLLYDMERSEQGRAHDEGRHHRIHHTQYHLLAVSNLFWLSSMTTPTAIHLAWTPDPTKLTVQYVTGSAGTPVVEYDELPLKKDRLSFRVEGTSDTYTASDMCEAPANLTELGKFQSPGYLHTVVLNELKPNQVYAYRVGLLTGQGVTWTPSEEDHSGGGGIRTYNFTAPLAPGDGHSFSYLVYGDQGCPARGWGMGGAWTSAMAAREVHAPVQASSSHNSRTTPTTTGIRAVHHFGDLSYAQGAAHIWDEWFAMIQPFSVYVPLMVAVGNHEYDHVTGGGPGMDPSGVNTSHGYQPAWGNFHNDSGGECGVPTAKRFAMPQSSSTSNGVFWYSHEFGSVHTTVLSSEHDLAPGSVQHVWLQDDLTRVNRTKTPWLIVELHRPLYEAEAEWDNNAVGIARRMEIEDLLFDNKVDVVLAGHYHAYHRSCDGLYRSRCRRGGPMHITVGSAGAHLDETGLYWNGWTEKFIQQEYGYGRITVKNATALHFEFVKAGSENDTTAGEVHDDVWIFRDRRY